MATTDMRYDHPVYMDRVMVSQGFVGAAASTIPGLRFAAYTDMLLKSVTIHCDTAGTTATQVFSGIQVIASGTSTSTTALTTYGTGVTTSVTVSPSQITIAKGDTYSVLNAGTDATAKYTISLELQVKNGATITV